MLSTGHTSYKGYLALEFEFHLDDLSVDVNHQILQ